MGGRQPNIGWWKSEILVFVYTHHQPEILMEKMNVQYCTVMMTDGSIDDNFESGSPKLTPRDLSVCNRKFKHLLQPWIVKCVCDAS
jgi:hypothetical protein